MSVAIVLFTFNVSLAGSGKSESKEPVNWEEKYKEAEKARLESQLALNRMTATAINLNQELLMYKSAFKSMKDNRINKTIKDANKALADFNKKHPMKKD